MFVVLSNARPTKSNMHGYQGNGYQGNGALETLIGQNV